MKKKLWIIGSVLFVILLLVPLSVRVYEDGGTRVYRALAYTLVDWDRTMEIGSYRKLSLYGPPYAYMDVDQLWEREMEKNPRTFLAVIRDIGVDWVMVEPVEGEGELRYSNRIEIPTSDLKELPMYLGCIVSIAYNGEIIEAQTPHIIATDWSLAGDFRDRDCDRDWSERSFEKLEDSHEDHIFEGWIAEIYRDKFLLHTLYGDSVLVEGTLEKKWDLADYVEVELKNAEFAEGATTVFRGELLSVKSMEAPSFSFQESVLYPTLKPVLYLYPEEETVVDVQLSLKGELTCTYPAYEDGWTVTAQPDGTLTDDRGQSYNYLYWEGEVYGDMDFSEGFCVPGEKTAEFLEWALAELGLTRREANEFIVYWLPLMEDNAYNIISFQGKAYTDTTELKISPEPDTLIRIYMTWKASQEWVDLPQQVLTAPERRGFVAVEWGGAGLNDE